MNDDITAKIATDLGIASMAPEEQKQLIAQFGEVALKAATVAVVEKLAPERREEFAKIAETGDGAALKSFLDAQVPGHEQIAAQAVQEEVKRFRAFQAP